MCISWKNKEFDTFHFLHAGSLDPENDNVQRNNAQRSNKGQQLIRWLRPLKIPPTASVNDVNWVGGRGGGCDTCRILFTKFCQRWGETKLFGATLKHQILVRGEEDAYLSRTISHSPTQIMRIMWWWLKYGWGCFHPLPFKFIIQFRYTDVIKCVKINEKISV